MPRRITSAEFVISAVVPRDFPTDGRPEIALVGRSNVGKSSLINALVRSAVARTSASPGKTRQVNVYRIDAGRGPALLPDGPARLRPRRRRREGAAGVRGPDRALFRHDRGNHSGSDVQGRNHSRSDFASPLRGVVLTVDARHPGLASDVEACRWLPRARRPVPARGDEGRQAVAVGEGEADARVPARRSARSRCRSRRSTGAGLDEFWQRLRELDGGQS